MPSPQRPNTKPWDSNIHDLSVYKPTSEQLRRRHESVKPSNTRAARAARDTSSRRAAQQQSLEALEAGVPDEASNALRELDQVEAQLQRLADDAQDMVPPDVAVLPLLDTMGGVAGDCETPPTAQDLPPWASQGLSLPYDELPVGDALDEAENLRHLFPELEGQLIADANAEEAAEEDEEASEASVPASKHAAMVVDLDAEIASFERRTGRAPVIAAMPPPDEADPPPHAATTPAAPKAEPKKAGRPVRPISEAPGWRPTGRIKPPTPAPSAQAARAPDSLGLARMQHTVSELTDLVATYEAERGAHQKAAREAGRTSARPAVVPNSPAVPVAPAARQAEAARPKPKTAQPKTPSNPSAAEASAAAPTKPARTPPPTFSACNAHLVELASRLVEHLRRANSELDEQATLRAEAEASLNETRSQLDRQADLAEAEMASLRREVRVLREEHSSQLAALQTQISSIASERQTDLVKSMVATLQMPTSALQAAPLQMPTLLMPDAPATPPHAGAVGAGAPPYELDASDAPPCESIRALASATPTATPTRGTPARGTPARAAASLFSPLPKPAAAAPEPQPEPQAELIEEQAAAPEAVRPAPGRALGPPLRVAAERTEAAEESEEEAEEAEEEVRMPGAGIDLDNPSQSVEEDEAADEHASPGTPHGFFVPASTLIASRLAATPSASTPPAKAVEAPTPVEPLPSAEEADSDGAARTEEPRAWVERAPRAPTPPRPLAPGVLPASAQPPLVRCSVPLGVPRIVPTIASRTTPTSKPVSTPTHAEVAEEARPSAPAAEHVYTAGADGEWDDEIEREIEIEREDDDESNAARSRQVLDAYYKEMGKAGSGSAPRGKKHRPAQYASSAGRRAPSSRVAHGIQPTQLFVPAAESEAEPMPRAALPKAAAAM